MTGKVQSLAEAVQPIQDGATVAMGGFGIGLEPIALVHQIIRQGTKDLTIQTVVGGNDVDLLVGAGAVSRVDTSGVSLEEFGLAQNFRRAAQAGEIAIGEYSEMTMHDRFLAGSLGLTFWPAHGIFGSDILKVNPDLKEITCPFTDETYVALPPARPEWLLLHAPFADERGNVYHPYRTDFADFTATTIRAARKVIVSVESDRSASGGDDMDSDRYTLEELLTVTIAHDLADSERGFFSAAQIDQFGNVNTSVIGRDFHRPELRLLGSVLLPEHFTLFGREYVLIDHNPRKFVPRVDFISGPGHLDGGPDARARAGLRRGGPRWVLTELGVFDVDEATGRMRVKSIHPGYTLAEIQERTGFALIVPPEILETTPPTDEEIRLLRTEIDPHGVLTGRTLEAGR